MYKAHLLFPDFIPALNFPVIGDDWRRNFVPFTYWPHKFLSTLPGSRLPSQGSQVILRHWLDFDSQGAPCVQVMSVRGLVSKLYVWVPHSTISGATLYCLFHFLSPVQTSILFHIFFYDIKSLINYQKQLNDVENWYFVTHPILFLFSRPWFFDRRRQHWTRWGSLWDAPQARIPSGSGTLLKMAI